MALVLDASIVVSMALSDRAAETVSDILSNEYCHIATPTAADVYYELYRAAGPQLSDHWLRFMILDRAIHVEIENELEFLRSVAEARALSGISLSSGYAAALAKKLGVPVLTRVEKFDELARVGFCNVQRI